MWDLPRPGLEPVSPALAGRFSTTAPPGKPQTFFFLTTIHPVSPPLVCAFRVGCTLFGHCCRSPENIFFPSFPLGCGCHHIQRGIAACVRISSVPTHPSVSSSGVSASRKPSSSFHPPGFVRRLLWVPHHKLCLLLLWDHYGTNITCESFAFRFCAFHGWNKVGT